MRHKCEASGEYDRNIVILYSYLIILYIRHSGNGALKLDLYNKSILQIH